MGDAAGTQPTQLQGLLAMAAPGKTPRVGWLHPSGHSPTQRPRRGFQGATVFCRTKLVIQTTGVFSPTISETGSCFSQVLGKMGAPPGGRSSPSGRERPRRAGYPGGTSSATMQLTTNTKALLSGRCPSSSASDERLRVPPAAWQGLNPKARSEGGAVEGGPLGTPSPFPAGSPHCSFLPTVQRPPATRDVEREIFIS